MRISLPIACSVVVAALTLSDGAGAAIVNGDLTGPVATGSAPPDWFNWQKTPDTCDANGPFNNTPNPWLLSPNGGTFVRTGGSDEANSEAFAQNVTGFSPGVEYQLSFYQTNLGFEHPTSGDWLGEDGFYDIRVDGALIASTPILSKPTLNTDPIAWSFVTINFIPTSADFELAFIGRSVHPSGLAAYMGIDGIDARIVPAPGVLVLFGLAGLARRRRRWA